MERKRIRTSTLIGMMYEQFGEALEEYVEQKKESLSERISTKDSVEAAGLSVYQVQFQRDILDELIDDIKLEFKNYHDR